MKPFALFGNDEYGVSIGWFKGMPWNGFHFHLFDNSVEGVFYYFGFSFLKFSFAIYKLDN